MTSPNDTSSNFDDWVIIVDIPERLAATITIEDLKNPHKPIKCTLVSSAHISPHQREFSSLSGQRNT